MKQMKIASNILLYIFYLLNIFRFITIFLFDNYSEQVNHLLALLMLSIFPLTIFIGIPFSMCLSLFKENGISYNKTLLCQKKDFKNSFLYYASIILVVINICIIMICAVFIISRSYGAPASNDGVYYFVSHGEILEYINYDEYKIYFTLVQQCCFSFIIIVFFLTSNSAKQLYNLLCKIKEKYNENTNYSNVHFQMDFDFNHSKTTLLIGPLVYLICSIVIIGLAVGYFILVNTTNNTGILFFSIELLFALYLLIRSLSVLKYGFKMLFESKEDVDEVVGIVSEIKIVRNPFLHKSKYLKLKYSECSPYAHIIVINNAKYYIMGIQNIYKGCSVKIQYLKKTNIVLSLEVE